MTKRAKSTRRDPEPVRSITAEAAQTAAGPMWLVAAGSDPRDQKQSILRYPEDIEPTLESLATIAGLLPRILDQLAVFLADRERRCAFAIDEATEAAHGPDVEPEAAAAARLLADAVPAARELAAALDQARNTITPEPDQRPREPVRPRRRRGYRRGRRL